MPGRNRRVRGEYALVAHHLKVGLGGGAERAAAKLALKQRQRKQRCMAFVHVVHVYMQAQRIRHAQPAHAQHDFLLQAVVRVAAVQVIGQPAIPAGVAVQIGIEQVDGHNVPRAPDQVIAPGAYRAQRDLRWKR